MFIHNNNVCLLLYSTHSQQTSKLVCFTPSSELLDQVPSTFSKPEDVSESQEQLIQHLFFSNTALLEIHKLSSALSYTNMKDIVTNFSKSRHDVLALLLNIKEIPRDAVNDVRLLIEEVRNANKLFALVLHFPIAMTSSSCYSALFLKGWDFHYLDSVGSSPTEDIFNSNLWFQKCYLHESMSTQNSIKLSLKYLMQKAPSIITSCVYLKSNQHMELSEKITMLQKLLEKGVGTVLINRFNSYWQRDIMAEYLQRAAKFTQKTSVTD